MSLPDLIRTILEFFGLSTPEPAPTSPAPDPDDPEVHRRMRVFISLNRRPGVFPAESCQFIEDIPPEERIHFVSGSVLAHGGRCPVCGEHSGDRLLCACSLCDAVHHVDCWTYARGCARYGCGCGCETLLIE